MGRSKWLPSFKTSAGDKLTVMRRAGNARPRAVKAARTRSRDSATALSGKPTMLKAGRPETIVTWVSTSTTSTPWNATVRTRATIGSAQHDKSRESLGRGAVQHQPARLGSKYRPQARDPAAIR